MKSLGRKLSRSLSYSNMVATLALFLALAGTAVAVTKAPKNSVVSASIKNGAVNSADIKNNAVKGADVDESSLSLPSFSVANNSLGGEHVKDGSLSGADLQDGGVAGDDVKDDSLSSSDVLDGSVGGVDVQDGGLTGADVEDGGLTGADVQDNALTGADVNESSLGPVPAALLGGMVRMVGPANCDPSPVGGQNPRVCGTATIDVPAPGGTVLMLAYASVLDTAQQVSGQCNFGSPQGPILDSDFFVEFNPGEVGGTHTMFDIVGPLSPGRYDFSVVCEETVGNLRLGGVRVAAVALSGG